MNITFSEKANLPTEFGVFNIVAFKEANSSLEHCILFKGDESITENVIVRIHSECLTGDALTSLKCDCGEQLRSTLSLINNENRGVVVYLRQEGRGIGLFNKINAYSLQDKGQNTIESNHSLGFETDLREYEIAIHALEYLGIKSIVLLSNNPEKIKAFEPSKVKLASVKPLVITPNKHNLNYLKVKKEKLNHLL